MRGTTARGRARTVLEALRTPTGVLVLSLAATVLLAVLANLTIELFQLSADIETTFNLRQKPVLFLLGTFVVWLLVLLVLAVTGRLWITAALVMLAALTLGYANRTKLALRLEPIYPSELATAVEVDFLAEMVGAEVVRWGVVVVVVVVALGLGAGHLAGRVFPRIRYRSNPRLAVGLILVRVCAVAVLLPTLHGLTGFNTPGHPLREVYERSGAKWKAWNQSVNYLAHGFVGGMLYNTDVPGMDVPLGYSRATMEELAARYSRVAARLNRSRSPQALADVNVVMVLSETLTDPLRLDGVEVSEDPIPFTRSLMSRTTSGTMLASKFGGGTANMEFSALTGMSLALFQPQMNTPYQMLVPEYQTFPSFGRFLEQHGHETVAIHPYLPSLYRRSEVYPVLGFDTMAFTDDMVHTDTIEDNDYVSDRAAFQEVLDHLDDERGPLFVNLVTMQNHFPMADKYADPIPVDGLDDDMADAHAEGYMRGLRYSDDALRDFIQALRASDEKTVLLLYGDHLPAFWPLEVRALNGARRVRETPFFVWANYGDNRVRRLPTTSPTHFPNLLMNRAEAPVSPLLALLAALRREVPAMEHRMMIGPDDLRIADGGLTERAAALLRDYRLVQYDLSVGERYVEQEMTTVPAGARGPRQEGEQAAAGTGREDRLEALSR